MNQAGTPDGPIDIHAHYYPQAYLRLIAEEGAPFGADCHHEHNGPVVHVGPLHAGPLAERFIDLDLRIAEMDAQGVAVQALSLTQPMVYWADADLARRLSAAFNDALVAAHEAHPDRLVGLAMLPLHHPDEALAELERISGAPGIRGIYAGTTIQDTPLSDERFLPVLERIAEKRLPIFLHPLKVIGMEDRLDRFFLANLLGNPFDTAVAAAHLIFAGVMDRFPDLDVVLPHAGGALPILAGRLSHGWRVRPECRHLPAAPMAYLQRFHYDTIAHDEDSLAFVLSKVGPGRVLLGSDYCFDMGLDRPVEALMAQPGLSDADRSAILRGNAVRLLDLG